MSKLLIFVYVTLALFAFVQADVCKIDGHTLKVGELYSNPEECQLMECTGPNEFSIKACPSISTLKPCLPVDNSKPFPKCCAKYEC